MSNDKSILDIMTELKKVSDEFFAVSAFERTVDPEPAPDKPVDWQVIIDEGLLCEFRTGSTVEWGRNIRKLFEVGRFGFADYVGSYYRDDCRPLEHQSVKVEGEEPYSDECVKLYNRLSAAGFETEVKRVLGGGRAVVIITGPLDGYTYEVQS